MPCNAIIQQAAQLGLNPSLILQHPAIIKLLADKIASMLQAPVAVCPANNWQDTYIKSINANHLHQIAPIADMNLTEGLLFFSHTCAIAIYPNGDIQLRDGYYLSQKPANPAALLQQITALIQLTAGMTLQNLVMAQIATVAQITNTQTAPNGALVLNINA